MVTRKDITIRPKEITIGTRLVEVEAQTNINVEEDVDMMDNNIRTTTTGITTTTTTGHITTATATTEEEMETTITGEEIGSIIMTITGRINATTRYFLNCLYYVPSILYSFYRLFRF
jgi:hypothetical protein